MEHSPVYSRVAAAPVPEVVAMTWLTLSVSFFVLKRLGIFNRKQVAWLISAINALVMVAGSIPFMCELWRQGGSVAWARQESTLSRGLAAFFFASLSLDLVLGFAYYASYLEVLTTILHHPVYMCMLIYALHKGYTTYFCLMLPMELPTLVLSIRILEPRLRNDAVHGIVFFTTRILYHIYMIATWAFQAESPTYLILASFFPFHVFCFHRFLKRRQSRYTRPKPMNKLF